MSEPRIHDQLEDGADDYQQPSDAAELERVAKEIELVDRGARIRSVALELDVADLLMRGGRLLPASAELPRWRIVARIAATCHELNRLWSFANGDDSHVPWAEAPDWQRQSAIEGVLGVLTGRVASPEESHASWMRSKLRDGWTWGATKDPERKLHPCLVPFTALLPSQQAKDSLFVTTVRSLAPLILEDPDR